MRRLKATQAALRRAGRIVRRGGLVAFPTETVYGLAADAGDDRAVAALYRAKRRPRHNPLIVHVRDRREAERIGRFDARARLLARLFWPGPLTLVLARRPGARVSRLAVAGLDSVALRCPAHRAARALIRAAGRPLVAPSANRSGRLSPTRARDVASSLGARLVLDGGACAIGVESTVIDLRARQARLLRPGAIAAETIAARIGPLLGPAPGEVRAPGQLRSHYAPRRPVRINAKAPRPGEAYLGFSTSAPGVRVDLTLSERGDLVEAAARLYRCLAELDRPPFTAIAVAPIPRQGLGEAINDRLARASAPRDADHAAARVTRGPSRPKRPCRAISRA